MPACNCEPNVCIDGSLLGSFFQKLLRSLKRFHKNPSSIIFRIIYSENFFHIMPHFYPYISLRIKILQSSMKAKMNTVLKCSQYLNAA